MEAKLTKLKKSRDSSKGQVTRSNTKLQELLGLTTPHLNQSVITSALAGIDRQCITQRNTFEATIETAALDGDELNEEEDARYREFEDEFQHSMNKLEELKIGFNQLVVRIQILGKLEAIENHISLIAIHSDAEGRRAAKRIELNVDKLGQLTEDYPLQLRSDDHLKGTRQRISAKLEELSSLIPEEETPPPVPSRAPARSTSPSRDRYDGRRGLPKMDIPVFTGNIHDFPYWWKQFDKFVHQDGKFDESDKLTYLKQTFQSPNDMVILDGQGAGPGLYATYIKEIKATYDRPRLVHRDYVKQLFEVQPMENDSTTQLKHLYATINNSILKLEATGQYDAESILTSHVELLMTPMLRGKWKEHTAAQRDVPPIKELLTFLIARKHAQDEVDDLDQVHKPVKAKHERTKADRTERPERHRQERPSQQHQPKAEKREVRALTTVHPCSLCKATDHVLYGCPKLLAMTVDQRHEFVTKTHLCYNCLGANHDRASCRSNYTCKTCHKAHHTLLHRDRPPAQYDSTQQPARANANAMALSSRSSSTRPETLAPTLSLVAAAPSGKEVSVTALLDTGADLSFITTQTVNRLGLPKRKCDITIVQALGSEQTNTNLVDLTLSSRHVPGTVRELTAVVVPHLGGGTNPLTLYQDWEFLAKLPLANPDFRQRKKLDVILGQDIINQIGLQGQELGDTLSAHETIWGWTVQGPVGRPQRLPTKETTATGNCTSTLASAALTRLYDDKVGDDLLRTFFKQETLEEEATLTQEDQLVLEHFQQTHSILPGGRFQVSLPRRQEIMDLGSSRGAALKRYIHHENSLIRRKALQPFQRVMEEYFSLQHAEIIPHDELHLTTHEHYYMPLHTVSKVTSTTTKLRVVFDASATTSSGSSLNDALMVGPTVHPPLTSILMRFRLHRIGLTADVSKMYREISLDPKDRDYHRFLWRPSPTERIQDCRMRRVTFGVASSPFMATQTLQQIASNHIIDHPKAAHSIRTDFYVDDFLSGADTIAETVFLQCQVFQTLGSHQLKLCKWRCSSTEVLATIHTDLREEEPVAEVFGQPPHQHLKTLGVHWDASNDQFHVSTSDQQPPATITKRALTSDVARTFDVLGWLTPATMAMKAVIQQLWMCGIGWDDPVPAELQDRWRQWRKELPQLADRPIARTYFNYHRGSRVDITLQGFADASLAGYAAVVYLRATYANGQPTVSLVQARSKVAPVKGLTVPRLELCGAALLSSLITSVRHTLDIPITKICCWTDSQVVLHWLDGKARRHRTFVSNRVRQTLDNVPSEYWHHVPGVENPADCASRGINPGELLTHGLWWSGPAWLLHDPIIYPPQPQLSHLDHSTDELVKGRVAAAIIASEPILEDQCSSYRRLLRTVAWCLRFRQNSLLRADQRPTLQALTIDDVARARVQLYKRAQARTVAKLNGPSWTKNKRLTALNPTQDDMGLFRINGRLRNSALEYAQRCPIILGGDDQLSKLLIIHHHLANGHAGPTLVMSAIGREHHLINGMTTVKSLCRNCVTCTRFRTETETQLMGQLPKVRVTPSSPFSEVGTDFAGPFSVKKGHTRRPVYIKGYICAFVCLTTKSVHLEVVGDLTTEAFISSLTRFVSRRGLPNNIYSDNGSNYVGASRELEAIYLHMRKTQTQADVTSFCTNHRIGWHFSPARAPHFGGIWESAIKAFKTHLKKITNGFSFTMEELTTLTIRIEAALNSRPLMPITSHSNEGVDVLTPGHFLIGRPLTALPEHQVDPERSPRSRHTLITQLSQQFWKRWSSEYLLQLNRRTKWQKERRDVQVGDIVLIRGDNVFATNSWPMARVITVFPGADGLVRAVDLQTKNNILRRPITKLTVLVRGTTPEPRSVDDPLLPGAMAESRTQSGMAESESSAQEAEC